MPMPNRAGKFRAEILDAGIVESGDNKLATVILKLHLVDELLGGEWKEIVGEGLEITAYNYLEKRDGSVNTKTVDSLRKTFPRWDGSDLTYWDLLTGEHLMCQVTLGFETYNNKERIKVQWVDPYDSAHGGDIPKASAEERRSIMNRLGAKLRANSGGTSVPPRTAAPASKAPAAPAQTKAPPAAPAPTATMDEAWEMFELKNKDMAPDDKPGAWFAYIKEHTGKTDPVNVTPQEWGKIKGLMDEIPF